MTDTLGGTAGTHTGTHSGTHSGTRTGSGAGSGAGRAARGAGNARRALLRLQARERRREARCLEQRLAEGELRVQMTKRVDIRSGACCAMEAGLRWGRAFTTAQAALDGGTEASMRRVGSWVLRTACAGHATRDGAISVAVPRCMMAPGLGGEVQAALEAGGMAATRLELRLAEAALPAMEPEWLLELSALRDLGCRLVVEEWGRRVGSVSLLRGLPLTGLLLDTALSHEAAEGAQTGVLPALVALGHALGLRVGVRAVERAERLTALAAMGVDEASGPGLELWEAGREDCPASRGARGWMA